jgi:hypothetical protein
MNITITLNGDIKDPAIEVIIATLGKVVTENSTLTIKEQPIAAKVPSKETPVKKTITTVDTAIAEAVEVTKLPIKFEAEAEAEADDPPTAPASSKYTAEQVRAIAVPISKAGKQAEVKALLRTYGVEKLTELTEADYDAFITDVQKLK